MKENGLDTIRKDMDLLEEQWVHKKGIFKNTSNATLTKELLKKKKNLKALKREDPEAFEQYYWEAYICVERDKMDAEINSGMISGVVAILVSIMSLNFSIVNAISKNVYWKAIIGEIMMFAGLVGIVIAIVYLKSIWNERERSYDRILLAFLEELRNAETEGEQACIVQNAEVK